jgi:hypothetical protein
VAVIEDVITTGGSRHSSSSVAEASQVEPPCLGLEYSALSAPADARGPLHFG